jgi:FAD/FMN-containing dehydrogenase
MTLTDSAATATIDDGMRQQIIDALKPNFAGAILTADSPEYESARQVWNAMIDKHPALIVRPTSTADVVAAVNVCRHFGQSPAVRAGGHSVSGKAMSEGGITIDMSSMREVTMDAGNHLAFVAGGCKLEDVDAATAQFAQIVPAGIMSETGVPGLALGGGIGWFSRKHGLTCDQFVALEVVLANGEVVTASETEHPDLFWALKGGGGNFGIVTRFTFRTQDFGPLMRIGVALYHPEDAEEALNEYSRILPTLPNYVGWHAALKHDMGPLPFVPPELLGKRMLMLITMFLNDADDAEGVEIVERLSGIGKPAVQAITKLPFGAAVQKLINEDFEDGHRYYTKEAHFHGLPEASIPKLLEFWNEQMEMEGEVELIHLGGAIGDLPEDSAAFAHREYSLWVNFAMRWDGAEHDADYMGRTRKAIEDLKPWTGDGVYVNMLNFDEMDRVVEAFGGSEKFEKLGRIKEQYDPSNLFSVNYNITPVAK